jgi:hypothetical protein
MLLRSHALWRVVVTVLSGTLAWTFTFSPPPAAPKDFAPAVFASVCFAMVVWGELDRRQRLDDPRFRKHLEDQHQFAKRGMNSIYTDHHGLRGEGWMPVLYTEPEMEAMNVHFPAAARVITRWTEATEAYQAVVPAMEQELERSARDSGCDFTMNGLTGLLVSVAKDWVRLQDITFRVSDSHLMADVGEGKQSFRIRAVDNLDEADALSGEVHRLLRELPERPLVKERRKLVREITDQRASAFDTLSKASLTQDLGGTCGTCPT